MKRGLAFLWAGVFWGGAAHGCDCTAEDGCKSIENRRATWRSTT